MLGPRLGVIEKPRLCGAEQILDIYRTLRVSRMPWGLVRGNSEPRAALNAVLSRRKWARN